MEVSSVHSPGTRQNGPPPTIPCSFSNVPGARNSTVVPSASPDARPSRAPRYLSLWSMRGHFTLSGFKLRPSIASPLIQSASISVLLTAGHNFQSRKEFSKRRAPRKRGLFRLLAFNLSGVAAKACASAEGEWRSSSLPSKKFLELVLSSRFALGD